MNYTIPLSATIFPPNLGPDFEAYQAKEITETRAEIARDNANAAASYSLACTNWTAANIQHRDYGLPLTPKPIAPLSSAVYADTVASGDVIQFVDDSGNPTGTPVTVSTQAGTLFMWDLPNGAPVGPPCPDLPAIVVVPAGHVHVGVQVGGPLSAYWQKCADDTVPAGSPPQQATSDDGVKGSFLVVSLPFGGIYLKIG